MLKRLQFGLNCVIDVAKRRGAQALLLANPLAAPRISSNPMFQ